MKTNVRVKSAPDTDFDERFAAADRSAVNPNIFPPNTCSHF